MSKLDGETLDRLDKIEFDGPALAAAIGILLKHCVSDPDDRRRIEHEIRRAMEDPPVHSLPSPHILNHRVMELVGIIRSS